MAGLQRSAVSFRRQGSSGLVWEDRFLSGELNQLVQKQEQQEPPKQQQQEETEKTEINATKQETNDLLGHHVKPLAPINTNIPSTIERSRSNGGNQQRGYRTGKVSPAIEPPSPKVSVCGLCSAIGKQGKSHRKRAGKGRSR